MDHAPNRRHICLGERYQTLDIFGLTNITTQCDGVDSLVLQRLYQLLDFGLVVTTSGSQNEMLGALRGHPKHLSMPQTSRASH